MKTVYENVLNSIYESSPSAWFDKCHKHRIVPGYEGGEYVESNVVFLTQREHSLVHWLRWKLFGDTRDKRAYKMIGKGPSGLSHQDRVDHGKLCAEMGIGIHSPDFDNSIAAKRGMDTQRADYIENGTKNFYYWSTPEGRKERAIMGGKASVKVNQAFKDNMGSFKDKEHARNAGAKSAKKPVHKDGVIRKFHTDDEREKFLSENPGWSRGTGFSPTKGKKMGPSPKRRKVTDGVHVYDSLAEAALTLSRSTGTIWHWCKSDKHPEWRYCDE